MTSSANRKSKFNGNDCGVIVAKCANLDDKNKVMEAKSLPRDSAHFRHISIFLDSLNGSEYTKQTYD